jgi:uncharacterized protein YndB with AHSA1/START domain
MEAAMTIDIDPVAQAGLTRREVRAGARDGQTTKVVIAVRRYGAEQPDVWSAITDPERIPRWFSPVSGDLKPGGKYQIEGNAGGTIERCDEPELFALTWEFGGGKSWVEVQLRSDGDATVLELRHECPVDDHWTQFGPGAVGVGWDLALLGLGLHLASGAVVDPQEAAAWSISDSGKAFVTACSAGWTEAAITGGEDESAARTAGAATTAFYTGAAQPGESTGATQSPDSTDE